jgi:hypothetical protein
MTLFSNKVLDKLVVLGYVEDGVEGASNKQGDCNGIGIDERHT